MRLGSRSLAWLMNGDHLVVAFRDAKLIGKDEPVAAGQGATSRRHRLGAPDRSAALAQASDGIGKREALASALAVDEVRLIVERGRGDDGHAGRLALWVGDADPYAAAPIASPLGSAASWDLWTAPLFGTTARGANVALPVVWTSLLIGAIPRQGKTFVMRLPLTAAVLDPHVRLIVADGKGARTIACSSRSRTGSSGERGRVTRVGLSACWRSARPTSPSASTGSPRWTTSCARTRR